MKICLTTSCGLWGRLPAGPEPQGFATSDERPTSYPDEGPFGPYFNDEDLRVSADRLVADFEKRMKCVEEPPAAPPETSVLSPLYLREVEQFLSRVSDVKWWHCSWQLAQDESGLIRLRHYA